MTDPVTGVINIIAEGLGIAKPFVNDYIQQKYENEHRERIKEFNEIMSEEDSVERRRRIKYYNDKLLSKAGSTVVGVSGTSIEVPLEYYASLVEVCSGKIKDDNLLANLRFK